MPKSSRSNRQRPQASIQRDHALAQRILDTFWQCNAALEARQWWLVNGPQFENGHGLALAICSVLGVEVTLAASGQVVAKYELGASPEWAAWQPRILETLRRLAPLCGYSPS